MVVYRRFDSPVASIAATSCLQKRFWILNELIESYLNNKDILPSHGLLNFNIGLSVCELGAFRFRDWDLEPSANLLNELWMGGAAKHFNVRHSKSDKLR